MYNPINFGDDQLVVNSHLWEVSAAGNPVWHARKIPGGEIAATCLGSSERAWETASPVPGPGRFGESLPRPPSRETCEESGIECEVSGLSGIYTDPGHVILYTSDGEVRQEFSIVLTARAVSGKLTPSSETSEARWVPLGEVDGYQMDSSMRQRIGHVLDRRDQPFVG